MRRHVTGILLACMAFLVVIGTATADPGPAFRMGFASLADQVPTVVGQPLEDEHWGANGDSLQTTTTGLMVWRKADNWTAFTDGATTWINGPAGVQDRANNEMFTWELFPGVADLRTPEQRAADAAAAAAWAKKTMDDFNRRADEILRTPPYSPSVGPSGNIIESEIDGEFEGWEGETVFRLMNGQIWQQDSSAYTYHYAYMPKVLIYRSGSRYKMQVEGVRDTIYVVRLK